MRHKLLNDTEERTHVLVFDTGDEAISVLKKFCEEKKITSARFSAIGAFSDLTLGYFNWKTKQYDEIPLDEQVEVLSLLGDVSMHDAKPNIHAHVVIGKQDGTAHGGHLLQARVRPTLEVMLIESPAYLRRRMNMESGLPLIDIDASEK